MRRGKVFVIGVWLALVCAACSGDTSKAEAQVGAQEGGAPDFYITEMGIQFGGKACHFEFDAVAGTALFRIAHCELRILAGWNISQDAQMAALRGHSFAGSRMIGTNRTEGSLHFTDVEAHHQQNGTQNWTLSGYFDDGNRNREDFRVRASF